MPTLAALLLDLDQTLLYSEDFPGSIIETCEQVALTVPGLQASELVTANGEVWRSRGPQTLEDWTLGRISGVELGIETWRHSLQLVGIEDEEIVRLAAQTHLELANGRYRLFEDVSDLLASAEGRGIPIALITNGASDTQRQKLHAVGIYDRFHALSISADHGVAKPEPEAFHVALRQLGVGVDAVWHVGDNLEADIGGANATGLTSVWINRNGVKRGANDPAPDIEIRSLRELTGMIDAVH